MWREATEILFDKKVALKVIGKLKKKKTIVRLAMMHVWIRMLGIK